MECCFDTMRYQILLCIVYQNAQKFTQNGSININVQIDNDNTLTTSITDTGVGIDLSKINNIFQMYGNIEDHQLSLRQNGVGLGLYTAKMILDEIGSTIRITDGLTQGTQVQFTFPIKLAYQIEE